MSLLLDARKKYQETLAASGGKERADIELSLEPLPYATPSSSPSSVNNARQAGQNLFNAKLPPSSLSRPAINRSLVYGLGGTLALLAVGGGYVWYAISDTSNNQPLRSINQPTQPIAQAAPEVTTPSIPDLPAVGTTMGNEILNPVATPSANNKAQSPAVVGATNSFTTKAAPTKKPEANGVAGPKQSSTATATSSAKQLRIEPQPHEGGSPDSLLNRAYAAYRNGQLEDAQRLYLDMLGKDSHNSDALLGLAAIAQQRNEDRAAVQYYSRVLNMDPRNAVANAGMSALIGNENDESRLKNLLREQNNSAALHFALGNLYARQSRWGEAQQTYFNAYSLDSNNADLAFNLAVSLDHLGQGKLAAQHYQQALQLDQSRKANFDRAKISQRIDELLR